jgi:chromosomal replication initiator protein
MVTLKLIVDIVARQQGVSRAQLLGKRRQSHIVIARHIAIFLCLEMVRGASLSAVGCWFGGRHHTTILHARDQMRRKIAADRKFAKQVEELRRVITKAG